MGIAWSVTKEIYDKSEGWPEYGLWGSEENHFFWRISSLVEEVREKVDGFYHQWHPSDEGWKDQHVDRPSFTELVEKKLKGTIQELKESVPPGEEFIFVNEGWLDDEVVAGRHAIPFLERDGEY